MRSEPRQQVIRRVTATFEVPVKEEDVDDEEFEESASASPSIHSSDVSPIADNIQPALKTKPSHSKPRNQTKRSVLADGDESYVEDEVDDGEEPHRYTSSSEEEDDELMMGAEVSPPLDAPMQCK